MEASSKPADAGPAKSLTAPWSEFWVARSAREKAMLGVLAAFLVGLSYYFLGLKPVWAFRDAAYVRLARAESAAVEARSLTAALAGLRAAAGPIARAGEPLDRRVRDSAAGMGLSLSRYETEPDGGVAVKIDAVPATTALRWLASLESAGVLRIRRLRIEPASAGMVGVEASLKERER